MFRAGLTVSGGGQVVTTLVCREREGGGAFVLVGLTSQTFKPSDATPHSWRGLVVPFRVDQF